MKRIRHIAISLFLAVALSFSIITVGTPLAQAVDDELNMGPSAGSLANFETHRTYTPDIFADVDENEWYGLYREKFIATAYEYALVDGFGATTFGPDAFITVAQAIVLAARVHCIYTTGVDSIVIGEGPLWFTEAVLYAVQNGIVEVDGYGPADLTRPATRAEMAYIFSRCLPVSEFPALNTVNALPDVDSSTPHYDSIILLYTAGVLKGTDLLGTFNPGNTMTRAEAAGIITRVILPSTRVGGRVYDNAIFGYIVEMTELPDGKTQIGVDYVQWLTDEYAMKAYMADNPGVSEEDAWNEIEEYGYIRNVDFQIYYYFITADAVYYMPYGTYGDNVLVSFDIFRDMMYPSILIDDQVMTFVKITFSEGNVTQVEWTFRA